MTSLLSRLEFEAAICRGAVEGREAETEHFWERVTPEYVGKLIAVAKATAKASYSPWTAEIECWDEVQEALAALTSKASSEGEKP